MEMVGICQHRAVVASVRGHDYGIRSPSFRSSRMEAMVVTLAKVGRWLRDAWLLIGITALLLGLLEGSLSLALLIKDRMSQTQPRRPEWRVDADAYPDRSWVTKYYEEFRASDGVRWRPYVYWRRGPYRGAYINVDSSGLRRMSAAAPPARDSSRAIRIFMF